MPLSIVAGSPKARVNIRTDSTLAFAFQSQINARHPQVSIILNVGSIFLDPDVDLIDPLDFSGFSVSKAACTAAINAAAINAAAINAAVAAALQAHATI